MQIDKWRLNGEMVPLPHVWGEETDLRWEGPAVYSASLTPTGSGWLVFNGVSAHARVLVNRECVCEHLGIWDAFSIRLDLPACEPAEIVVEVTKNGGTSIPVDSIASGFLPYVFGTFGGIYRPVEWMESAEDPLKPKPAAGIRARFEEGRMLVDGKPAYLRGLLHWGWYPKLRHPHPDVETCRKEVEAVAAMGFNCVKFCLWAPPHHYLELLEAAGMCAWMELPVWNPGPDIRQIRAEIERIVLQYRHHKSIILWTVGCELGNQMTREDRKALFDLVKTLTGGAPVKDSSGGAEMYGGDPVEYGDFDDFHPYCDLAEYFSVLDALQAGARKSKAILLGECNDFDSIRDIRRVVNETPYWASDDPFLNAKGVRWQHDLPGIINNPPEIPTHLLESSKSMKLFVHRVFQELVIARNFAGSVITGIVDTPISTSGFFDDWGEPKFDADEVRKLMGPNMFFLIPQRRLPWIDGGNRVGTWDPWHVFEGPNLLRIGMHSEEGFIGPVRWAIEGQSYHMEGEAQANVPALTPTPVAEILWDAPPDQRLTLTVNGQTWPIETVSRLPSSQTTVRLTEQKSVVAAPAFREAAYDFRHPVLKELFEGKWHTLLQVLRSMFLDPNGLPDDAEILAMRIDTRTYRELPLIAMRRGKVLTTLQTGNDPAGELVRRALSRL